MLRHPEKWDAELKPYVTATVSKFKDDPRIAFWETINEPDNTNGSSYGKQEPKNKVEMTTKLCNDGYCVPVQPANLKHRGLPNVKAWYDEPCARSIRGSGCARAIRLCRGFRGGAWSARQGRAGRCCTTLPQ